MFDKYVKNTSTTGVDYSVGEALRKRNDIEKEKLKFEELKYSPEEQARHPLNVQREILKRATGEIRDTQVQSGWILVRDENNRPESLMLKISINGEELIFEREMDLLDPLAFCDMEKEVKDLIGKAAQAFAERLLFKSERNRELFPVVWPRSCFR